MFTTHIENVDEEFEIEVSYDYQPYEDMTRHYPGCSESVDIYDVRIVPTNEMTDFEKKNNEICLLPSIEDDIEMQILDHIQEESEYIKYGDY